MFKILAVLSSVALAITPQEPMQQPSRLMRRANGVAANGKQILATDTYVTKNGIENNGIMLASPLQENSDVVNHESAVRSSALKYGAKHNTGTNLSSSSNKRRTSSHNGGRRRGSGAKMLPKAGVEVLTSVGSQGYPFSTTPQLDAGKMRKINNDSSPMHLLLQESAMVLGGGVGQKAVTSHCEDCDILSVPPRDAVQSRQWNRLLQAAKRIPGEALLNPQDAYKNLYTRFVNAEGKGQLSLPGVRVWVSPEQIKVRPFFTDYNDIRLMQVLSFLSTTMRRYPVKHVVDVTFALGDFCRDRDDGDAHIGSLIPPRTWQTLDAGFREELLHPRKYVLPFTENTGISLPPVFQWNSRPACNVFLTPTNEYAQYVKNDTTRSQWSFDGLLAPAWQRRKNVLFWRGLISSWDGSRSRALHLGLKHPDILDIKAIGQSAATKLDNRTICDIYRKEFTHASKAACNDLVGRPLDHEKQLEYRFALDLDGKASSQQLKNLFLGGFVVFKVLLERNQRFSEFYYEDLVPMVHYIPIPFHRMDEELPKMVRWACDNPAEAKRIASNGQFFAQQHLSLDSAQWHLHAAVSAYASRLSTSQVTAEVAEPMGMKTFCCQHAQAVLPGIPCVNHGHYCEDPRSNHGTILVRQVEGLQDPEDARAFETPNSEESSQDSRARIACLLAIQAASCVLLHCILWILGRRNMWNQAEVATASLDSLRGTTLIPGMELARDRDWSGALQSMKFIVVAHAIVYYLLGPAPELLGSIRTKSSPCLGLAWTPLFFLLSGFLSLRSQNRHPYCFGTFLSRRLIRLYPTYMLSLIACALTRQEHPKLAGLPFTPASLTNRLGSLLPTLFLVHAWVPNLDVTFDWNAPSWCLSTLFAFYLLFPLWWNLFPREPITSNRVLCMLFVTWVGSWIPALLQHFANLGGGPEDNLFYSVAVLHPLSHWPSFVFGMLLNCLPSPGTAMADELPEIFWRKGATVSAVMLVFIFNCGWFNDLWLWLTDGLLLPLFGTLIVTLAAGFDPLAGILETPALVSLGKLSYPAYVLMVPVTLVIPKMPTLFSSPLGFVATLVAVATITYVLIERPVLGFLWKCRPK